jgi:PilZ domain
MSADPNGLEHSPEVRLECRLERRGAQRFEVHLPLAVQFEGRTVPGFTQDLSGRGILFYAETTLPQGATVELTFTMPSEITLAESMPVRCRGRVLRASASLSSQRNGIAVQFISYEYLPSDGPVAPFVRVSAATAAGAISGPMSR